MAKNHNWNQFHKILYKLGYIQVSSYENQFLYYRNPFGDIITIQKEDDYPIEYVNTILKKIGVSYEIFVRLYSNNENLK